MKNANMPKGRGMVKWQPFASMPEQFVVIKEMIKEQTKASRPIVTQDEKEMIENKLLTSFLGEEEVLLTYYKDGYLYKNYITVVDINPLIETITCTDAFCNKRTFKFFDVIEID
ncbi:TPA: YolD-like family protein [Bacillus cereus]|uniref:YolD-like family protein n=2 Tax=Bacillus thuringiensis TaxID=1428 RepID=UPI000BF66BD0|nr:YolD-like family protein [Bacillus thuringiensis]MCU4955125.1 YolD-like family protein [Bacillus cereus]PFP77333.1 3-oxoacyl-ACP synthase [Bacillus thuringiensis]PGW76240.1 3-oxoacyl-ACP synthase [Bacillus thuringiensis]